jgi:competence protein ComGC
MSKKIKEQALTNGSKHGVTIVEILVSFCLLSAIAIAILNFQKTTNDLKSKNNLEAQVKDIHFQIETALRDRDFKTVRYSALRGNKGDLTHISSSPFNQNLYKCIYGDFSSATSCKDTPNQSMMLMKAGGHGVTWTKGFLGRTSGAWYALNGAKCPIVRPKIVGTSKILQTDCIFETEVSFTPSCPGNASGCPQAAAITFHFSIRTDIPPGLGGAMKLPFDIKIPMSKTTGAVSISVAELTQKSGDVGTVLCSGTCGGGFPKQVGMISSSGNTFSASCSDADGASEPTISATEIAICSKR